MSFKMEILVLVTPVASTFHSRTLKANLSLWLSKYTSHCMYLIDRMSLSRLARLVLPRHLNRRMCYERLAQTMIWHIHQ